MIIIKNDNQFIIFRHLFSLFCCFRWNLWVVEWREHSNRYMKLFLKRYETKKNKQTVEKKFKSSTIPTSTTTCSLSLLLVLELLLVLFIENSNACDNYPRCYFILSGISLGFVIWILYHHRHFDINHNNIVFSIQFKLPLNRIGFGCK